MTRSNLYVFAAALALPTVLFAGDPVATLGATEGTVMVNTGERYVNAQPGQLLEAGHRIMVLSGAKAEIEFNDGCKLPLEQNSVAVVPEASTCAGAVADVHAYGPMYAQAVGSSATDATAPAEQNDRRCGDGEDDDGVDCVGWWVFGGAAVGYGLYAVFKDDDDEQGPVSN